MYAPYTGRRLFWDNCVDSKILSLPSIIIVGDLNLTIGGLEIWGIQAQLDPLSTLFSNLFDALDLRDVTPVELVPNW